MTDDDKKPKKKTICQYLKNIDEWEEEHGVMAKRIDKGELILETPEQFAARKEEEFKLRKKFGEDK